MWNDKQGEVFRAGRESQTEMAINDEPSEVQLYNF